MCASPIWLYPGLPREQRPRKLRSRSLPPLAAWFDELGLISSPMTTITLGPARMGDAPAIAHLSRDLIETDLPWSWTPRRVAGLMRQRESSATLAKDGNRLAGFILAQYGDESVHIALLGVANEYRRQGIGRRLVQWVEDTARVAGLFLVRLEVRAVKRDARFFYASLGYREMDRMEGYYSGIEDAIKLSRDLRAVSVSK
jgi:ribosomal protein S18 acetylase RimI-like enzyme